MPRSAPDWLDRLIQTMLILAALAVLWALYQGWTHP